MDTKNLVTKIYFKKELKKELKSALKNYATKDDLKCYTTKDDLKQLRKDINEDFGQFISDSLVPLLDKMGKKLDDTTLVVNTQEHRLDKHEDKLLIHDRQIKNLELNLAAA